jgi:hypothetical protein
MPSPGFTCPSPVARAALRRWLAALPAGRRARLDADDLPGWYDADLGELLAGWPDGGALRTCPACRGTGWAVAGAVAGEVGGEVCPICDGERVQVYTGSDAVILGITEADRAAALAD